MSLFLVDHAAPVPRVIAALRGALKGGEGSGFHGHAGRPGKRGGSADTSIDPALFVVGEADTTLSIIEAVSDRLAEQWQAQPSVLRAMMTELRYDIGEFDPQKAKKALIYHTLRTWTGSSGGDEATAIIAGLADRLGLTYELPKRSRSILAYMETHYPGMREAFADLGEIIYRDTQDWLARQGKTHVTLYRAGDLGEDRLFTSWSTTIGGVRHETGRSVIDAVVPASAIFSLPVTGFGTRTEAEAVVLPRPKVTKSLDALKGGEGSGFHGHAGRPGKRGGSAPSRMDLGDVSDRLDVTRDTLLYGTRSVMVDGVRVHIGVGVSYPSRERPGDGSSSMVDTDGKIIAGPKDWLMQDALAVPEVAKAVDDAYAALGNQRGGDFAKAEPTDYQDRIAALLHGYKSPLTYARNLDTLNAMTRAYLANDTAEIVRSEDRVAKLERDHKRLLAYLDEDPSATYLQSILDKAPAELFKAKVTALAFADRAMELGDQEAVNQFSSEVQRTQADLRERYGDTVTLYRGVNGDYAKAIKKGTKKAGSEIGVAIYPASSWTSDASIAREFATKSGVVIKQSVPVDRILFSYHTSPYIRLSDWPFGGKQEYEFIIASPSDTLTLTKEDLL